MFHMEATVPVKKGCWSAGSEEDEVSFETLLVDDRSPFERGEDGTFGLRETNDTLETPALAGLIFVSILSRLLKRTCKDANNMLCAVALSAKITDSEQESESFIVQFCGYAHC
jgi:hypothetical protein